MVSEECTGSVSHGVSSSCSLISHLAHLSEGLELAFELKITFIEWSWEEMLNKIQLQLQIYRWKNTWDLGGLGHTHSASGLLWEKSNTGD